MFDDFDERDPLSPQSPGSKKILRVKELPSETGLSVRTIWDLVAAGKFPAPIQIGARAVGWLGDEIAAWREEKRRERDERFAAGSEKDLKNTEGPPKRPRGRPRKDHATISEED